MHLWILNCNNTILGNNYVYCKITTPHLLILIMYLHKDEIRVHNKVNENLYYHNNYIMMPEIWLFLSIYNSIIYESVRLAN